MSDKNAKKQIFDGIGMFAAIITVISYLLLVINAQWPFLGDSQTIYNILIVIRHYAPLVVVGIVGLEFVSERSLLTRVVYYVAVALIVVSMFFPSTWNELVGIID